MYDYTAHYKFHDVFTDCLHTIKSTYILIIGASITIYSRFQGRPHRPTAPRPASNPWNRRFGGPKRGGNRTGLFGNGLESRVGFVWEMTGSFAGSFLAF
jgi:hypothetical protein